MSTSSPVPDTLWYSAEPERLRRSVGALWHVLVIGVIALSFTVVGLSLWLYQARDAVVPAAVTVKPAASKFLDRNQLQTTLDASVLRQKRYELLTKTYIDIEDTVN